MTPPTARIHKNWPKCERCERDAKFVIRTDYEQFISCDIHQQPYGTEYSFPIQQPKK